MFRTSSLAIAVPSLAASLVVVSAIACSSSSSNPNPVVADSGTDATLGGDAPSDGSSAEAEVATDTTAVLDANDPSVCGSTGPYIPLFARFSVVLHPSSPVTGATVKLDVCKDKTFVSDHDGNVMANLTKGANYLTRIDAPGYMPLRVTEYALDAEVHAEIPLFPVALKGILQDWSDSKPMILVAALTADTIVEEDAGSPNADAGACAKNGIVISVPGHPEAAVTYYDDGSVPVPNPSLTSTSASGVATIAGLASSPTPIEISAVKPGCKIDFKFRGQTGRFLLEDGVLTVAAPKITLP